jgi:hypothetical protein
LPAIKEGYYFNSISFAAVINNMLLSDCIVSDVPVLAVIPENMGMDTYNSAESLNL